MDLNKKYYTYVLICSDNSLYTGYTNDVVRRLKVHNQKKGAKYTKYRTPVKLYYYEIFEEKGKAMSKEAEIKKLSRNKKLEYINTMLNKKLKEEIDNINKEY